MSNILRLPAATAGTVPAAGTDYQKQNDQILRLVIARGDVFPVDFTNNKIVKGASFNVGGVFYYASADEPITGTASNYVKLTPISAGAQCSAAYVANLSGVSWSDTYNGYVDGSGNLYLFDEAKALAAGAVSTPKTFHGKAYQNIPHGRTVVTSSGNFTVPAGVYFVNVEFCGGGGGGGGGGSQGGQGGGGGSSGEIRTNGIFVTPGQTIACTIGAGGSPGTGGGAVASTPGGDGGNGVNTVVSGVGTASGGRGGKGGSGSSTSSSGLGRGGIASVHAGDKGYNGEAGQYSGGSSTGIGGSGGGAGGSGGPIPAGAAGFDANANSGGGGGGGCVFAAPGNNGGAGGSGYVIFWW